MQLNLAKLVLNGQIPVRDDRSTPLSRGKEGEEEGGCASLLLLPPPLLSWPSLSRLAMHTCTVIHKTLPPPRPLERERERVKLFLFLLSDHMQKMRRGKKGWPACLKEKEESPFLSSVGRLVLNLITRADTSSFPFFENIRETCVCGVVEFRTMSPLSLFFCSSPTSSSFGNLDTRPPPSFPCRGQNHLLLTGIKQTHPPLPPLLHLISVQARWPPDLPPLPLPPFRR